MAKNSACPVSRLPRPKVRLTWLRLAGRAAAGREVGQRGPCVLLAAAPSPTLCPVYADVRGARL